MHDIFFKSRMEYISAYHRHIEIYCTQCKNTVCIPIKYMKDTNIIIYDGVKDTIYYFKKKFKEWKSVKKDFFPCINVDSILQNYESFIQMHEALD